jgi:YggT family protein
MNPNVTRVFFSALIYFAIFLQYAIFARVILSWVRLPRENFFVRTLHAITEPVLGPVRGLIEKSPLGKTGMPIDFSPIITFLLIRVVILILQNVMGSIQI